MACRVVKVVEERIPHMNTDAGSVHCQNPFGGSSQVLMKFPVCMFLGPEISLVGIFLKAFHTSSERYVQGWFYSGFFFFFFFGKKKKLKQTNISSKRGWLNKLWSMSWWKTAKMKK